MTALTEEFIELVKQIARVVRETGVWTPATQKRTAEFCGMKFDLAITEKPDLFMLVCGQSGWAVELETFRDGELPVASYDVFGNEAACHRDLIYIRMATAR